MKDPYKIVNYHDIKKVRVNPKHANKVLGRTFKETVEDTLDTAWNWHKKFKTGAL